MSDLKTMLRASMTERQLQDAVLEHARLHGWLGYHTHDSRRSAAGFPDLILVRGTEMCAWELKSEKGRMRPGQQDWLDAFAAVPGCDARLVRPSTYDQACDHLARRGDR